MKVNLLNTQVDIPTPLMDFKGVVVLFMYDQPMNLTVESALGEEGGPPLSLGCSRRASVRDQGEGAIIEFSVEDPPAGLVSWKFQLLQPSEGRGPDLAPLQDVVGGSPVFHQIFWNGRQNYFGTPLPAGRYECVLTAPDAKNRQRTLHRWIQLVDASAARGRRGRRGQAGPQRSSPELRPADLAAATKSVTLVKESSARVNAVEIRKRRREARPGAEEAARKKAASAGGRRPVSGAAAAAEPAAARSRQSRRPAISSCFSTRTPIR